MDEGGRVVGSGTRRADGRARPEGRLQGLPTKDLVAEVARKATELARKEVELAKAELRKDLRDELKMAGGLGVGAVCAILVLALLLVAMVLALAGAGWPGWAAALVVAAGVLLVGALASAWGWAKRVRRPLQTTRRSLEENVRWAKGRFA